MKYQEIKQTLLILKKIKKYQLLGEFKNRVSLMNWLKSLNKTQINNFLNVDLDKIKTPKWILINLDLLNDDYFLQDIELISNAEPDIAACLFRAAKKIDPLREKYDNNHSEIMNLIANASSKIRAKFLTKAAMETGYESDMELIANAKSDAIAEILCKLTRCFCGLKRNSTNVFALSSKYRSELANLIANAKSDGIAWDLYYLGVNVDLIVNEYHREAMNFIANAKSDTIAHCLRVIAKHYHIFGSEYCRAYMEIVANAKSDEEAKRFINYIFMCLKMNSNLNAIPSDVDSSLKQTILLSLTKLE